MIDISVLYAGMETPSKPHRYGRALASPETAEGWAVARSAASRKPIVVWNLTRTCNLRCVHCYSDSACRRYEGELTTEEGRRLLDSLARYGVPAVLFSGGEPLTRPDWPELARYGRQRGLHVVLSTNGTLIDAAAARTFREVGLTYVGISLDGMEAVNDRFRGVAGAFRRAMAGFRHCVEAQQKVGLRLTLTRQNAADLDAILDFIQAEGIHRACFYHLVPTGRGRGVLDLTPAETRQAVDTILRRTGQWARAGRTIEILTVDNHCDGAYVYLKLREAGDRRADEVYRLLQFNGGGLYSSGVGIGCVDSVGDVHPDQFWTHYRLGNVRQRDFGAIWEDTSDPLMAGLKDKAPRLKGRCGVCRFKDICGGAMRVRADLYYGDPWAPDPGCYLTDEEIGLTAAMQAELAARGEDYVVPVSVLARGGV